VCHKRAKKLQWKVECEMGLNCLSELWLECLITRLLLVEHLDV